MGLINRLVKITDLWDYTPEYNADGTEKHVNCDGARFHVLSWSADGQRCSCANCEINHPPEKRKVTK